MSEKYLTIPAGLDWAFNDKTSALMDSSLALKVAKEDVAPTRSEVKSK